MQPRTHTQVGLSTRGTGGHKKIPKGVHWGSQCVCWRWLVGWCSTALPAQACGAAHSHSPEVLQRHWRRKNSGTGYGIERPRYPNCAEMCTAPKRGWARQAIPGRGWRQPMPGTRDKAPQKQRILLYMQTVSSRKQKVWSCTICRHMPQQVQAMLTGVTMRSTRRSSAYKRESINNNKHMYVFVFCSKTLVSYLIGGHVQLWYSAEWDWWFLDTTDSWHNVRIHDGGNQISWHAKHIFMTGK